MTKLSIEEERAQKRWILARNASRSFGHLFLVLQPHANALRGELTIAVRGVGTGRNRVALDFTVAEAIELSRRIYDAAVEAEHIRKDRAAMSNRLAGAGRLMNHAEIDQWRRDHADDEGQV